METMRVSWNLVFRHCAKIDKFRKGFVDFYLCTFRFLTNFLKMQLKGYIMQSEIGGVFCRGVL